MKIRSLVGAGLGLVVALTLASAPAGADGGFDPSTPSGGFAQPVETPSAGAEDEPTAEEALATVESIFTPVSGARMRGQAATGARGTDATMALRDLWMKRGELRGEDAKRADALLARPVPGQTGDADKRAINGPITSQCADGVCLHFTESVGVGDLNDSATAPDVEATRATVQSVRTRLINAGFKTPLPDSAGQHGGTSDLDVYLMNLRQYGLYGYCAPTEGFVNPNAGDFRASTYCVVDNDFVGFGTEPSKALQVTVAHEYFHAVQGAYDFGEDRWLVEGSAAWIEDELYDSINDNRMYLPGSQMKAPWLPLDSYGQNFSVYGSWIFLRYLSEKLQRSGVAPLEFMRRVWARADSAPTGPDDWSLLAVKRQIDAAPKTFPGGFARTYNQFAAANRVPKKYYSEGSAYPKAPTVAGRFKKRTKGLKTTSAIDRLDHLTSYTARLVPHKSYGKKVRLKIAFNLPAKSANPGVTVRIFKKNGKFSTVWVPLNKKGDATKKFAFTRKKKIAAIEVTVSNGSTSFYCWTGSILACQGSPRHDGLRHKMTVTVLR
ncbi:MXAN_6640 family putative metalloprotease [Nocardioides sp. Bht2]|uniref:MXAN_6640 family putative metalloprotease n=1 Tax=Nocardioides sp. Bht2 TaxID=3392297 RepID=UPI0039B57372